MNHISPQTKTIGVTILLCLAGIIGIFVSIKNISLAVPLIIFYASITLNTYYSMKLFNTIAGPHTFLQDLVDITLVVLYIYLAFNFNNAFVFTLTLTVLFIVAVMKYILLLAKIPYQKLLKNKIKIDSAGVILCLFAFAAVMAGYIYTGIWLLTIIFGISNLILLYVRPMYRI